MSRKLISPKIGEKKKPKNGKIKPPYETHAENFYYLKQMKMKTPMIIVMIDGEIVKGKIEWYDRNVIKVNREQEPNLVIFKHSIKYMLKDEEDLNKK